MTQYSESETLIADSAAAFFEQAGGVDRVRRIRDKWPAFDRAAWEEIVGMGWLGMLAPESKGGLELGIREAVVLLENIGRSIPVEPVVGAITAAFILAKCDTDEADNLLADLMGGEKIILPVGKDEKKSGIDLEIINDAVNGRTGSVADMHGADAFLVWIDGKDNAGLYVVEKNTTGVDVEYHETVDGGSVGCLIFKNVDPSKLKILSRENMSREDFSDAGDVLCLGNAALMLGLMKTALEITTEYMKTRQQFGSPIGSFQALQHRAASLYVAMTSSRALVYEACRAFGSERQSLACRAAKARSAESTMALVKECIQFHGAIGFTDECDIGLYFRRAMALSAAGGNPSECRRRYAEIRGDLTRSACESY